MGGRLSAPDKISLSARVIIEKLDYDLWEVIEYGNSFKPVARTTTNANGSSTLTIPGPITTEEKAQKKNDVKARSMLLMALPNEHQLTFSQYKDAKTLFEAIQARFGGNEATKKTQRTLLKQMYENFSASSQESLDSISNRLQKIVSLLAILGENISQEDLNFKFLRSLPSEWSMHVVVWRNKPDLGTISFDDLYNNFKIVEQEVKRSVTLSSNSSSENVAFVSTPGSSNEDNTVNVQVNTASTNVSTTSTNDSTASLSDATINAFLANQPNSLKARKFYQRTTKKIIINGSDTTGYDKSKVEWFNCHKMGHFARECRGPRNQESRPKNQESRSRNQESSKRTVNVEDTSSKAMVVFDGAGFDWSFMGNEEVPTNLALIAFSDSEFDLATYKRGIAFVKEQLVFYKKNDVMLYDQITVLKRDASFRDSEINALNIQIEKLKKDKESNQIKIDKFENASKSLDKLIGGQISDNNRKALVLRSFNSMNLKAIELMSIKVLVKIPQNENKRNIGAPIIKDWVSECDEDECEEMIFDNVQHKSEPKLEQAKQPRKINQNPRNNRTNRNEKKTQKLGVGFQFTKKACFVCGSFNQLIKDCDFHDKKMVQKPMINNVQKGTGQKESGIVSISTARKRSSKAAAPLSAARPINTDAPKLYVNVAKTKPNVFQKTHSLSRRPFNQQTALNNRSLNNKVNTAKVNSVNTTKGKRVTSAVGE
ncbi:ribonuclease H-like domain-containing protein [Tanacetum coccineum]